MELIISHNPVELIGFHVIIIKFLNVLLVFRASASTQAPIEVILLPDDY